MSIANRSTYALGLTLLLLVSGCGETPVQRAQRRLMGKWSGDLAAATREAMANNKPAGDNPLAGGAGALGDMMLQMAKPSMEFDLQAEGKMKMTVGMMGKNVDTTGTWQVVKAEGDQITVSTTTDKGSQEQTITMVDDDTFRLAPAGQFNVTQPITFKRVK